MFWAGGASFDRRISDKQPTLSPAADTFVQHLEQGSGGKTRQRSQQTLWAVDPKT
jgi:hypothetical protein